MLKLKTAKIERFAIGEYIIEVEEVHHPSWGKMWDAWVTKDSFCVKSYMFGVLANQTQAKEHHIYTKDEALDLIFANAEDYIEMFKEEYENEDD